MLGYFINLKNVLPFSCYNTFDDIPLSNYYRSGKKVLIIDLDNTLVPYDEEVPNDNIKNKLKELIEIGFIIYIASNNHPKRVKIFCDELDKENINIKWMAHSFKPFKRCYKWALTDVKKEIPEITPKQILSIGDQLITDCLGSNKSNIDCILVRPIKKKTEKWYTKLNRMNERILLKRMRNKYPSIYKEIIDNHD